VLRQRTRARAHALVGWLSGRLDLSVRPCGRARGVAGVGVVYQTQIWYPTPKSTDPLVAMIRSTGSSR
jgi:hypothetical protein